jgi:hypothetical protein
MPALRDLNRIAESKGRHDGKGTQGTSGTDSGVDCTRDIAVEAANELGIIPTIACLYSEQRAAYLVQRNRDGRISPSHWTMPSKGCARYRPRPSTRLRSPRSNCSIDPCRNLAVPTTIWRNGWIVSSACGCRCLAFRQARATRLTCNRRLWRSPWLYQLPSVLRWRYDANANRQVAAAEAIGVGGDQLAAAILAFATRLGVPTRLREVGIGREQLKDIVAKSLHDPPMRTPAAEDLLRDVVGLRCCPRRCSGVDETL